MFLALTLALVLMPLQNERPTAPQDALALLNEVGQGYANAKSYHVEAVRGTHINHDLDSSLGAAFQRAGVPLGILIDAGGNVAFYKSVYEITELRNAIAKLGPEYSAIRTAVRPAQQANHD